MNQPNLPEYVLTAAELYVIILVNKKSIPHCIQYFPFVRYCQDILSRYSVCSERKNTYLGYLKHVLLFN